MIIESDFEPAWWLPGGHLQTLWPVIDKAQLRTTIKAQRLELSDGDFVDLAWTPETNRPLICLFHGLEGSLKSHYLVRLLNELTSHGFQAVLMHFRGCSGEANRLVRSYHSGDTGDINFLIKYLIKRFPQKPLAAIGISLGGNALLKYLAEDAHDCPLVTAVSVSAPLKLADCANRINRGLSKIYQAHLVNSLNKSISRKHELFSSKGIDWQKIIKSKSFWEFDDTYTAPAHGFDDAKDYYKKASSATDLHSINTPTLILQALDDPFMTPNVLPRAEELSPHVNVEVCRSGGHVGFVGGSFPGKAKHWLPKRIIRHLQPFFA